MSQTGTFEPHVGDAISIDRQTYVFQPNPVIKGIAYVLEGGRGRVYKLAEKTNGQHFGLKTFRKKWRTPEIALSAAELTNYSQLPGMGVCNRTVLTPQLHTQVIALHDELSYAVLMPWIEGMTWFDFLFAGLAISRAESITFARSLVLNLVELERMDSAHTDIAGANAANIEHQHQVNLVDVEEMFGPGMPKPVELPAGQAGYQHRTAPTKGNWHRYGDRFGASVILSEMLGWHDPNVRQASSGEGSFFLAQELQDSSNSRYTRLAGALRTGYPPAVADLFEQAWMSNQPEDCPSLNEWSSALAQISAPVKRRKVGTASTTASQSAAIPPEILPARVSPPPVVTPLPSTPYPASVGGQSQPAFRPSSGTTGPTSPFPPAPPMPPPSAGPAAAPSGGLSIAWLAAGAVVIVLCLGLIATGVVGALVSASNIPAAQIIAPTSVQQVAPAPVSAATLLPPVQSSHASSSDKGGSITDPAVTSLACPGALGPSFKAGDHFIVPYGDGASGVFEHPNEVPKVTIIPEGSGGTILSGPVCVKGQDGNLLAWYVQTDDGYKGWIAEGYGTSKVPWMVPDR